MMSEAGGDDNGNNSSNNNINVDPLSQALSMLDSLNDNEDIGGGGFGNDNDFEDFAIDSDGEENEIIVATNHAVAEFVAAPQSLNHHNNGAVNSTNTAFTTNNNTNSNPNDSSSSSSTIVAHPLQEVFPVSTNTNISSSAPSSISDNIQNGNYASSSGAIGSRGCTTAATGGGGGGSSWTSNLASFVTTSRVAVAAAVGGGGNNNIMVPTTLSSSSSSSSQQQQQQESQQQPQHQQQQPQHQQQQPQSSKMTYTERQRLLHEQYYQATNNYASKPSSSSLTVPPPVSSSSVISPTTTISTLTTGEKKSQSAIMTGRSSSSSRSSDAMAPNLVLSPISPSKTLMTTTSTNTAVATTSSTSGSSEHTATTPTTVCSSPPSSNTTFAEKLTSSLDATTKMKLIASALGCGDGDGQVLLPGERVIMFLNMLKDVRDCTCEHTLMNLMQDSRLGGGWISSSSSSSQGVGNNGHEDNIHESNMDYNNASLSSGGGSVAITTVWCCAMTFYRVAVFSYQATLDGEILFPDDDDDDDTAACEDGGEEAVVLENSGANTTSGGDTVVSMKNDNDVDSNNNNNNMIQQWLRSQNVSIQFQGAHCRQNSRRRRGIGQRHYVFQMPLASIERVGKTLASSQIAMGGYGVGIHPSSSYSLTNPATTSTTIGGYSYGSSSGSSVMQQLLHPSSSSLSSSTAVASNSGTMMSSAMMSLGSQMIPLLGGMASGIGGGVVVGVGSGSANLLTNGSNKWNNVLLGTDTMDGYATTTASPLGIKLHGKDGGRWIAFSTCSNSDAIRAHEALNTYAFPGRKNLGYLFAFESRRADVMMMAASASQISGGHGMERQSNNNAEILRTEGAGSGSAATTITTAAAKPTRRRFVPLEEYKRQGIFQSRCCGWGDEVSSGGGAGGGTALAMSYGSPWAPILTANANYGLCATYPNVLVGPRSIVGSGTDDIIDDSNDSGSTRENNVGLLRRCAAFRAGNRLPSLTWGSSTHGGSIWRAAQPKVGLQGNRSIEDERYLYAIGEEARRATLEADEARRRSGMGGEGDTVAKERPPIEFLRMLCGRNNESDLIMETAGNSSCLLKIMDMRPKTSAMANRTQGYGYENTNHYRGTTINFYGIGNIHAVRDAYQKISALCLNPNTSDVNWMQLVENTNWPSMTRLILSASWQTAFHVHYNHLPVLVHCSHGWDRTSQVPALAQLLLDPHYRTREGFSTLVEKDFLSFGHPFHTRCGHGEGKNEQGRDEEQLSPIFLQFLDCVFQLVNQFPDYFEFNSRYLLLLSEHIYSCRFGTLLCDSEREREVVAGVRQRTYCLWDYLDAIPELVNPLFDKSAADVAKVLLMPLPMLLRNVTLWTDRFCMYGSKATMPCFPPSLRHAYPPSYLVSSPSEQPMVLHTMRAGVEGVLARAISDLEMWKGTALSALKELTELKNQKGQKDERSSRAEVVPSRPAQN